MKYKLLPLVFVIFPQILRAQTAQLLKSAISIEYNDVIVGRNLNLTYHSAVSKRISLYGGVKFHINQKDPPNDWYVFRKKTYAENGIQHWGVKAGIEASIFRMPHSELFAFYDFQYTHATIRQGNYFTVGYDSSDGSRLLKYQTQIFGPVHTFENYFGVGARFSIVDRIYAKGFIGGGGMLIKYNPVDNIHHVTYVGSSLEYQFGYMFGLGLEYKLN